jgi:hypothetical protein
VDSETFQMIAAAVIAVAQVYTMDPSRFKMFAQFWDILARICGQLANMLALVSVHARANYFLAVQEMP